MTFCLKTFNQILHEKKLKVKSFEPNITFLISPNGIHLTIKQLIILP